MAAVFVWFDRDTDAAVELVERTGPAPDAPAAAEDASPFASAEVVEPDVQAPVATNEPQANQSVAAIAEQEVLAPVDVAAIARSALSDEEFEALVERLRNDPALLAAVINEARAETDPERLGWLLRVLGEVDDPAVVALATELVYGGDPELRKFGLDLMKRVRPGDPDVLASVSGLLSTEVESDVLVPALTALARPAEIDSGARASLVGQVAILTDHVDPSVRRTSLTILSRWSQDSTYTPRLLSGLDDPDPTVRRAAAFALVGHEDDTPQVRNRLMRLANDSSSEEGARRGAILALKRLPLEDSVREQVLEIERGLDSRPLR